MSKYEPVDVIETHVQERLPDRNGDFIGEGYVRYQPRNIHIETANFKYRLHTPESGPPVYRVRFSDITLRVTPVKHLSVGEILRAIGPGVVETLRTVRITRGDWEVTRVEMVVGQKSTRTFFDLETGEEIEPHIH